MNIYLVSQGVNNNRETYDAFVCRAPNEQTARNMHPSGNQSFVEAEDYGMWADPNLVRVVLLAENVTGDTGVVLADFGT